VPLVLWQHDRAEGRSLIERWASFTPADLVVCNSVWTSKTAAALQPRAPVVVIHPPVSVTRSSAETRAEIRRSLQTDPGEVVIFSASRFEPWKGHRQLLRALGRLREIAGWTLWIAGSAQRPHEEHYAAELRADVARLELGTRVRFLGQRRDVPSLMRAADVFCQPNEGPEPFGIVFAEALLSEIPVVTVNLGGAPEIVADTCGRLVPAGNVEALATALQQLVEDSTLRKRLGASGSAHASARVAPELVLPQIARALERLGATAAA
jgi:glycosyltransferase involved in cell wall biosynthesis